MSNFKIKIKAKVKVLKKQNKSKEEERKTGFLSCIKIKIQYGFRYLGLVGCLSFLFYFFIAS